MISAWTMKIMKPVSGALLAPYFFMAIIFKQDGDYQLPLMISPV